MAWRAMRGMCGDDINSCCYNYSMQAIFVEASKACGDAFVIVIVIVMARLHVVFSCDVLWIA